ncbi:MAG TPA: transposase [Solirubrobacteraceae bacterium]
MPQNFIESRREQGFLLPPDVREWLPEDHLAWFVIDAVARMDLGAFYVAYRADGHGRAAYEPSVMVALILFSFSTNVQSSRAIEHHCRQDVAYRVITGNLIPDHATIARFICRHEQALGELFSQVLGLCDEAGLMGSGVVAIDGTKLHANASRDANVDYDQVAREIIAETIATDEAEDERHGDARGDELPPELQTEEGRREWLARHLESHEPEREPEAGADAAEQQAPTGDGFDAERIVARVQGREGWLREAKRRLDLDRWRQAEPVPRSRSERLRETGRRLEQDLAAVRAGNEAYERWRATATDRLGRSLSGNRLPKPYTPPATPRGEVNLTDPDARVMKAFRGYVQGYNAQAAVNEKHIVLAAEVTVETVDFSQLKPMVDATLRELEQAGIRDKPRAAVADAGYWNEQHMDDITGEHGIPVLVTPDSSKRKGERPGWTGGRYAFMRRVLATDLGGGLYRLRKQTVEPVIGHTKHNRGFNRFRRRGRKAVRTEWRLQMMTHNLTKLHNHQMANLAA